MKNETKKYCKEDKKDTRKKYQQTLMEEMF